MVSKSQLRELRTNILKFGRREGINYRDLTLSVQASDLTYCSPKMNGLHIEEYESVEVAVIQKFNEQFVSPVALVQEYGLDDVVLELNEHWDGDIGSYVPIEKAYRLKKALDAKFQGCQRCKIL